MKSFVVGLVAICCSMYSGGEFVYGQAEGVQPSLDVQALEIVPIKDKVVHVTTEEKRTLTIHHKVKGRDVYIECFIPNFTFSKKNGGREHVEGEGHLRLFIDGQRLESIYQAAFILKGLPDGEHTIKIQLVKNNDSFYGIEDEFTVSVPAA